MKKIDTFLGRETEIQQLKSFLSHKKASLIAIKGRRRVGKSTLVEDFSKNFSRHFTFTGLFPEKNMTADDQRQEFCRQMSQQCQMPNPHYHDWGDIFWALAPIVSKGRVLLFFDELSWMAHDDPTFLPKLKDAWDRFYKKNPQLILIVCASASSWIEKNMLLSSAFVGRISFVMKLLPLPLNICSEFWGKERVSAYEKLKVIAVTGCIPRYLEEIHPQLSAEENIKRLCFTAGGLLVNEFDRIFNDLFLHDSMYYKKILSIVCSHQQSLTEICDALSHPVSGRISEYLHELEEVGFISRYFVWSLKTGLSSANSLYRINDPYLRFYLKYIEPNKDKINKNKFQLNALSALPGWNTILAFQFENIVINNRHLLIQHLQIHPDEIVNDGPYFQMPTKKHAGCQIDYLFQTKFNTLYICEMKFSKSSVGKSIIKEMQEKLRLLVIPKNFSVRLCLLHVNGVDESIEDSQFFTNIIDVSQWL